MAISSDGNAPPSATPAPPGGKSGTAPPTASKAAAGAAAGGATQPTHVAAPRSAPQPSRVVPMAAAHRTPPQQVQTGPSLMIRTGGRGKTTGPKLSKKQRKLRRIQQQSQACNSRPRGPKHAWRYSSEPLGPTPPGATWIRGELRFDQNNDRSLHQSNRVPPLGPSPWAKQNQVPPQQPPGPFPYSAPGRAGQPVAPGWTKPFPEPPPMYPPPPPPPTPPRNQMMGGPTPTIPVVVAGGYTGDPRQSYGPAVPPASVGGRGGGGGGGAWNSAPPTPIFLNREMQPAHGVGVGVGGRGGIYPPPPPPPPGGAAAMMMMPMPPPPPGSATAPPMPQAIRVVALGIPGRNRTPITGHLSPHGTIMVSPPRGGASTVMMHSGAIASPARAGTAVAQQQHPPSGNALRPAPPGAAPPIASPRQFSSPPRHGNYASPAMHAQQQPAMGSGSSPPPLPLSTRPRPGAVRANNGNANTAADFPTLASATGGRSKSTPNGGGGATPSVGPRSGPWAVPASAPQPRRDLGAIGSGPMAAGPPAPVAAGPGSAFPGGGFAQRRTSMPAPALLLEGQRHEMDGTIDDGGEARETWKEDEGARRSRRDRDERLQPYFERAASALEDALDASDVAVADEIVAAVEDDKLPIKYGTLDEEEDGAPSRERWEIQLESMLRSGGGAAEALRQDRCGVAISPPLKLTAESWSELRRIVRRESEEGKGGERDAAAPPSSSSDGGRSFRLPRLAGSGGTVVRESEDDWVMDFGHAVKSMDEYVPEGYEDFVPRGNEGERQGASNYTDEKGNEREESTVYLLEIADAASLSSSSHSRRDAENSEGAATLDDYAFLSPPGVDASVWEDILSVTITTSARVVALLEAHGRDLYGDALELLIHGDEEEGEEEGGPEYDESDIALPVTVGRNGAGDAAPSLVAVVAIAADQVDPETWASIRASDSSTSSSMFPAELVFRFGRRHARFPGESPDPFVARVAASRFYIGRAARLADVSDNGADDIISRGVDSGEGTAERAGGGEEAVSAIEFLRKAMLNADRFVPEEKKRQWDEMPDAIAMVEPYRQLPPALAMWMQRPGMRCSRYDPAYANCILHLEAEGLLSPMTTHVTKHSLTPLIHELGRVHDTIRDNVNMVRSETKAMTSPLNRRRLPARRQVIPTTGAVVDKFDPDASAVAARCKAEDEPYRRNGGEATVLGGLAAGYVSHLRRTLELERLRCVDDMRRHDLYSARWERVDIVTPLNWGDAAANRMSSCRKCRNGRSAVNHDNGPKGICAYHLFFRHKVHKHGWKSNNPGGAIPITSGEDLEVLAKSLLFLTPVDRLIAKIVVPGVAENYPLVSMGDLVRFRFSAAGLTNEVVGEVVDVVVKTEVVSVLLPAPFHGAFVTYESLPYVQALLRTRYHMIDAGALLQALPTVDPTYGAPLPEALRARRMGHDHDKHAGRFDLRLGFLGGRGFDIARSVLAENAYEGGNRLKAYWTHVCRVIAPTVGACRSPDGRVQRTKTDECISNWVSPLNEVQKKAVSDVVFVKHERAPYIIFGPAGTGKTLTVCEAIIQVLRRKPGAKILVCAPSDAACDVLASRILPVMPTLANGKKMRLLRVNWWCRKAASLPPSLLLCTPVTPNNFFTIPRRQDLEEASVIVCQCFVAGCLEFVSGLNMRKHFTHLFIDETSQAMECEALVPCLKVSETCSIILAGDHKQLGPTVRDPVAVELGLGMSIQERLMKLSMYQQSEFLPFSVMTKLTNNYRSHDALLTVPSALFYGGQLKCAAPKEFTSPYADLGPEFGPAGFPMVLYDVSEGKEHSPILDSPSFYNLEECNAIIRIIDGLLKSKKVDGSKHTHTGEIAVITPFRSQVLMLRNKLRNNGLGSINVGVVEDFQGQETSIVIISTVLTQPHKRWSRFSKEENVEARLGFMHDPKRFNVAITRARAVCVVVGHAQYLRESETYWTALIEHIERNKGIVRSKSGVSRSNTAASGDEGSDSEEDYGIRKLVKRVQELKLLGAGHDEDRYDLAFYYEDTPQWKVMLA